MLTAKPLTQAELLKALDTIGTAVKEAVAIFGGPEGVPGWGDRQGGFFSVQGAGDLYPRLVAQIGEVPYEKIEKYMRFSQEKARRLAGRAELGDISSWQSRNEKEEKWGGAVLVDDLIFSFSGFPELGDEAICLVAFCLFRDFNPRVVKIAEEIAAKSGNTKLFASLFTAVVYAY